MEASRHAPFRNIDIGRTIEPQRGPTLPRSFIAWDQDSLSRLENRESVFNHAAIARYSLIAYQLPAAFFISLS
jgi:hypothetical protein